MENNYITKSFCACCNGTKMDKLYDFGRVPLAGNYILKDEKFETYPLSISYCLICHHIQVDQYVNSSILFKDYRYMSGFSMKYHFSQYIKDLKNRFNDFHDFNIIEIGSNDGTLLNLLQLNSKNAIGFEPSDNVSKASILNGNKVINDFFSLASVEKNNFDADSVDLVTASNCFAHISEIDDILDAVRFLLKPETGTFIIEVHYTPNLIEQLQYDFIYHEHMYYYSLSSLKSLLNRCGLEIYDFEFIPIHGGSIRVYSKKAKSSQINKKIQNLLENESQFYKNKVLNNTFSSEIFTHLNYSRSLLEDIKNEGKNIVGFGASGRVNAFLNYLNIGESYIDYIFDESPERIDRYIPKLDIPIIKFVEDDSHTFDTLYLSAWNFSDQIFSKLRNCNFTSSIQFFPKISYRKG
jgi:ubiquinone/menaquinone biosynthesis C-methylase UbiE